MPQDEVIEDQVVLEEGETPEVTEPAEPTEAETADEAVLTIGDEPPAEDEEFKGPAPEWVKDLRKERKELLRENRELKQKLTTPAVDKPALGAKPTLEACDYDADKFADQLEAWHLRKRDADAQQEAQKKERDAADAAWNAKQAAYSKQKSELKLKDVDEAEEVAKGLLSITQQGLILQGADNSALLIQAIGRNPKVAKDLAAIKDPVQFAFAVAKLETKLKVEPRRAPPVPESRVSGDASMTGRADQQLAKLEAEADRTGDRTKVAAYRRAQMLKARQ